MSKPITPDEVGNYKTRVFPAYVFDAFNEAITAKFTNSSATVKQDDVIDRMLEKANEDVEAGSVAVLTRAQIFKEGYLNVEDVYREYGWKVEYDKPGYCENYDAFFVFKRGK